MNIDNDVDCKILEIMSALGFKTKKAAAQHAIKQFLYFHNSAVKLEIENKALLKRLEEAEFNGKLLAEFWKKVTEFKKEPPKSG